MSEKLSEMFAEVSYENPDDFKAFCMDNYLAILSALQRAEQPPTDAAGMREMAAKVADDIEAMADGTGEQTDFVKGISEGAHQIATNIRALPLPPSPTADALRAAEEALVQLSYNADNQDVGHKEYRTRAMVVARDALAAIRKTKEG